ncbi:MAG: ABC transporter substrate-binding protein [Chloroflexi bacterium]|nr:ABC transporter substrate-binding protein [Chloroflexota bacterium]
MPRALVAGVESAPANFDMEQPAAFGDSVGSDISSSVYEQLTGPRPLLGTDGVWRVDWSDLEAQLAEGWWFSPDGRTCTFRLRPGVRSPDGNELTAEDVRWSWERSFGVRDVGKWVARISSVQEATDVEVVDPLTVAFHLRAPNPALPRTMAQGTPNVYDSRVARAGQSPEDPWASSLLGARPSGFGPYRLVRADGESLTEIEANPHYHGGPPPIGEVVARRYPSTEEAIQALLQGDVDLVPGVPWSALSRVRSERRLRITPAASTAGVFLHLDPGAEPLDDPRVRQAIAHATPYRAVLQTAYAGTAERWYSWVKPESPGYDPASWPYEEDVGRARALLASSKGAGGFSTSIVVLPGEGLEVVAELLAERLGRLGISADVRLEPRGGDRSGRVRTEGNLAPIMVRASHDGRGQRVAEPLYAYYHDWGPGRMRLFPFRYHNEEFFDALRAVPEAGHGASWAAAVRRLQRLHNRDAVMIPLCAQRYYVAHDRELEGYCWLPENRLPFARMRWRR